MTVSASTSNDGYLVPHGRTVRGEVEPPSSKSLTLRWLCLALVSGHGIELGNPLVADDTLALRRGLEALGWSIEESTALRRSGARTAVWSLRPPASWPESARIDCGASGTMLRLLTAALAVRPGLWVLDGTDRLRERPMEPLLAALRQLGAGVRCLERDGHAPIEVEGRELPGGSCVVDASRSSQFLSALLLVGARCRDGLQVEAEALTSVPYVALTEDVLATCGVVVGRPTASRWEVAPAAIEPPELIEVECDLSAAGYPAAAAALTGGEVRILGARAESAQGDRRLFDLLLTMGADVSWGRDGVRVRGTGRLRGISADLAAMPDQVPTVAALAPFASGVTRLDGVPHLRDKESDRLRALATELRRLGAEVEERPDGLTIPGLWADRPPPGEAVTVDSWNDHRIAMSLALVGLRRPGVQIRNPEVVAKSYPNYWRDLEWLTRG